MPNYSRQGKSSSSDVVSDKRKVSRENSFVSERFTEAKKYYGERERRKHNTSSRSIKNNDLNSSYDKESLFTKSASNKKNDTGFVFSDNKNASKSFSSGFSLISSIKSVVKNFSTGMKKAKLSVKSWSFSKFYDALTLHPNVCFEDENSFSKIENEIENEHDFNVKPNMLHTFLKKFHEKSDFANKSRVMPDNENNLDYKDSFSSKSSDIKSENSLSKASCKKLNSKNVYDFPVALDSVSEENKISGSEIFSSSRKLTMPSSIKYVSDSISNVSFGLKEHILREKKYLRLLRLKKMGYFFIGLLFVVCAGWCVYGSSLFALSGNEIALMSKTVHVSKADVRVALNGYVGVPLPRIQTSSMENLLEKKFVWVKKASVSKQWPNGVAISIKEREGVAIAKDENKFVLLDKDGVRLEETTASNANVPIVQVPVNRVKAKLSLRSVLDILSYFSPELRSNVGVANANDKDNVEFELKNGVKVIWGKDSDNKIKAKVLEILMKRPGKIIDVSSPTKPVTTL